MDKGHGRLEERKLWSLPIDPATLGLAGAHQLIRVHRHVLELRQGKVIKERDEVAFAFTSFLPEEAGPQRLQELVREHWSIENGQFHRRDRTQREDHCTVGETSAARNLSLFRSLAIFLFKAQSQRQGCPQSLPDFEQDIHRHPGRLIGRLTGKTKEEDEP